MQPLVPPPRNPFYPRPGSATALIQISFPADAIPLPGGLLVLSKRSALQQQKQRRRRRPRFQVLLVDWYPQGPGIGPDVLDPIPPMYVLGIARSYDVAHEAHQKPREITKRVKTVERVHMVL